MTDRHMIIRIGFCVLMLLARLAAPGLAQNVSGRIEDRRVRVITTDSRTIIGTVVRSAGDTLTLATGSGELQRIPWSAVRALDASRGKAGRIGSYAGVGAGIGITVGVGAVVGCKDTDGFITCRDIAPVLIGGSMLIGLVVGAVVGARGPERWEQLPVRVGVGAAQSSDGARTYLVVSRPLR